MRESPFLSQNNVSHTMEDDACPPSKKRRLVAHEFVPKVVSYHCIIYAYRRVDDDSVIVYVGLTRQTMKARDSQHRRERAGDFDRAYADNLDGFRYEIIESKTFESRVESMESEAEAKEEASIWMNDREKHWIAHYDTYNNGMNNTIGGAMCWKKAFHWAQLKKHAQFLSYDEAKTFVHTLGLKSHNEWVAWAPNRPHNIPCCPATFYANEGCWEGFPSWLGYRSKRGGLRGGTVFLPFEEARSIVHGFGLKSHEEWVAWFKSDSRPANVPSQPSSVYLTSCWLSLAVWIGYKPKHGGKAGTQFVPFQEARVFARRLNFQSQAKWKTWSASGARPLTIPGSPYQYYLNQGWLSWPDFLGYAPNFGGRKTGIPFVSFSEARAFVHQFKFDNRDDFYVWIRTSHIKHIPQAPKNTYKDSGWISWPDWLGRKRKRSEKQHVWDLDAARSYVHTLNLSSHREWKDWCKRSERPVGIPTNPKRTYAALWVSFEDWLGCPSKRGNADTFGGFQNARRYMHTLGLKSIKEWRAWTRQYRPTTIPSDPPTFYSEWVSWPDWLGYQRTVGSRPRAFQSFVVARTFVRRLGLKSIKAWRNYCSGGSRPKTIPSNPDKAYADDGWVSMPDWMGYAK